VNDKRKKRGSVVRGTITIITGKETKFAVVNVYCLYPLVLMVKLGWR
jgi:hypothetical protein